MSDEIPVDVVVPPEVACDVATPVPIDAGVVVSPPIDVQVVASPAIGVSSPPLNPIAASVVVQAPISTNVVAPAPVLVTFPVPPSVTLRSYEPEMQPSIRTLTADCAKIGSTYNEFDIADGDNTTEMELPGFFLAYPSITEQADVEWCATGRYTQTGGPQTIQFKLYEGVTGVLATNLRLTASFAGIAALTGVATFELLVTMRVDWDGLGGARQSWAVRLVIYPPAGGAAPVDATQRFQTSLDPTTDHYFKPTIKKNAVLAMNALQPRSFTGVQFTTRSGG